MIDTPNNFGFCHRCEHFPTNIHGDVPCGLDGISIEAHATFSMCPAGKFGLDQWPKGVSLPVLGTLFEGLLVSTDPDKWGPEMWHRIHTSSPPTKSRSDQMDWFRNMLAGLPCGECATWAEQYITDNAPDFGVGWHRYTWQFHNAKNEHLGKRLLGWDEARSIYGWPDRPML